MLRSVFSSLVAASFDVSSLRNLGLAVGDRYLTTASPGGGACEPLPPPRPPGPPCPVGTRVQH